MIALPGHECERTRLTIVQANSHDEATKIFADSAHFHMPESWIEVMEIVEMPEM